MNFMLRKLGFVKKDIVSILKLLKGMEFVQSNQSYCERIEKSIKILHTIHASLESEVEIMKKLDHPAIAKIYEFYEDDQNYIIISELC